MKRLKTIAFVLLLMVAGQLYAQPAQPSEPAPPVQPSEPAPAGISLADIQARTAEAEIQVKADEQKLLALQALARKQKDVIKLTCVNDKMVQVKAQANLFDQSRAELASVLDTPEREAAFESMSKIVGRIGKLREEAEACIGQPELSNEFANEFKAPPIPDDPTAGVPFDEDDSVVEPPGYASPYN